MNIPALEGAFQEADKTESFAEHNKFIKDLIASNDFNVLQFHFDLLKRTTNQKFYHRLRAAFEKRGGAGKDFLIDRVKNEPDSKSKGDAIQILGHLRAPEVLPFARGYLLSPENYLRYNSIIVLGWMGESSDVDLLGSRIRIESDPTLRGYLTTAFRQIFLRLPETKNKILFYLKDGIEAEQNTSALELMIISTQTITKKYFGLRENINEGTITGDIEKARAKALSFFLTSTTPN